LPDNFHVIQHIKQQTKMDEHWGIRNILSTVVSSTTVISSAHCGHEFFIFAPYKHLTIKWNRKA